MNAAGKHCDASENMRILLTSTARLHNVFCQHLTCTEGLSTTSRKALRALESYWDQQLESS